jgi:serine/threonine protein kinase
MLLNNHYKLGDQIGKGGSAVIHLLKRQNKQYVLKTFQKENHQHQFLTEINALVRLQSVPNIVKLHDFIQGKDKSHLVLDELPYGNLKEYFGKRLTEVEIKKIVKQCLQILSRCHGHNIVHNDVKPENFMFMRKGDISSLHLIDFDNAIIDGNHQLQVVRGTPYYMSIESMERNSNEKSDIWSIGVLIYHMLTFGYPFDDIDNPDEPDMYRIFASVFNDKPTYPKNVFSPQLIDLLNDIFKKDHKQRPCISDILRHKWFQM